MPSSTFVFAACTSASLRNAPTHHFAARPENQRFPGLTGFRPISHEFLKNFAFAGKFFKTPCLALLNSLRVHYIIPACFLYSFFFRGECACPAFASHVIILRNESSYCHSTIEVMYMKRIPTTDLKPGMFTARPVRTAAGQIILDEGCLLSAQTILHIHDYSIPEVWIRDSSDSSGGLHDYLQKQYAPVRSRSERIRQKRRIQDFQSEV